MKDNKKCSFYRERSIAEKAVPYCVLEDGKGSCDCKSCVGDFFMDAAEVAYVLKEHGVPEDNS